VLEMRGGLLLHPVAHLSQTSPAQARYCGEFERVMQAAGQGHAGRLADGGRQNPCWQANTL
jgi:hypothetical protein